MKVVQRYFTPGETETASGRAVASQRNDRRMGMEPAKSGHGRYDHLRNSTFFVREQMSKRGIGPSRSAEYLDLVAQHVAYASARFSLAWTPAALSWIEGLSPVPTSELQRQMSAVFVPEGIVDLTGLPKPEFAWSMSAGIVIWPNNEFDVRLDFWKAYGELTPADIRGMGVIVMLSFYQMGRLLAARLPRPIFDIEEEN